MKKTYIAVLACLMTLKLGAVSVAMVTDFKIDETERMWL